MADNKGRIPSNASFASVIHDMFGAGAVERALNDIAAIIEQIARLGDKDITKQVNNVLNNIKGICEIIVYVGNMKLPRDGIKRTERIRAYVDSQLIPLCESINNLGAVTKPVSKQVILIKDTVESLKNIFDTILSIHTIFIGLKVKMIIKSFPAINLLIQKLAEIDKSDITNAEKNLALVKSALGSLFSMMVGLTLMVPLMITFAGLTPVIAICLIGITKMLSVLGIIINNSLDKRTLVGLHRLRTAILILIGTVAAITVLALMAPVLYTSAQLLLAMFSMLILVAVAVRTFAWIVRSLASKRMLLGLYAFGQIILILIGTALALWTLAILAVVLLAQVPILTLFFLLISAVILAIVGIGWTMSKLSRFIIAAAEGMLVLTGLILLMLVVASALLLITTIATEIIKNYDKLLLFFLGLVPIAAAIIGLGALLNLALPIMLPALIGVSVLALLVFAITAIAVMLLILQNISLDKKLIQEKVSTILDTVQLIMATIFDYNGNKPEKSNMSFLGKLGTFLKVGIGSILVSILSSVYLATAVFSVLSILLIASMLRMIQGINLKQSVLLKKIDTIINCAQAVTNAIYGTKEAKSNPTAKKGILNSMISFISPNLGKILDAISSAAFLTVSVISVLMIAFLASELRFIQSINLDENKISKKVQIILNAANNVIDAIYGTKDDANNPSPKRGLFGSIFHLLAPKLSNMTDAIFSVAYLALSIISVHMVMMLAGQLKLIADAKFNENSILNKVDTIIAAAKHVITSIYAEDKEVKESKNKSIFDSLLDWLMPAAARTLIDAITSIGFLASALTAVKLVAQLAEELTTIAAAANLSGVDAKTTAVIVASQNVINAMYDASSIKINDRKAAAAAQALRNVDNTLIDLYRVSVNLNTFNKAPMPNVNDLTSKINIIYDSARLVANQDIDVNGFNRKIDVISNLQKIVKSIAISDKEVKNIQAVTKETVKFVDKIDSANIEKLRTTENIFKNLATLSESISGNFEGLADALNEKIAPLLEDLKNTLVSINTSVDNSTTSITEKVSDTNNTIRETSGVMTPEQATQSEVDKWAEEQKKAGRNVTEDDKKKYYEEIHKRKLAEERKRKSLENTIKDIYELLDGITNATKTKVRVVSN